MGGVARGCVSDGVDGGGSYAEVGGGPQDTNGDLAAVGHEQMSDLLHPWTLPHASSATTIVAAERFYNEVQMFMRSWHHDTPVSPAG